MQHFACLAEGFGVGHYGWPHCLCRVGWPRGHANSSDSPVL